MKLTPIQKTCFAFNFPDVIRNPGRKFTLIVFLSLLLFHLPVPDAIAQTDQIPRSVTGTVKSNTGELLPGVSIVVKGTVQGTITDVDGRYSLTNVPPDATLVFSFVGMKTFEMPVAGKNTINVEMVEDAVGIEEVVAIGYGVQKKVNLTGSVGIVESKEFEARPITNVVQSLQGQVPGLMINQTGGQPGDEKFVMKIRGTSTFSGNR